MDVPENIAGGRVTIDLDALTKNWLHLRKLSGNAECSAVVKANAYGCGIETVVPALIDAGCETFFVALPEEGARVRALSPNAGIFVLNGLFSEAGSFLFEHRLSPVLNSMLEVERWAELSNKQGFPLPCALQLDTGMGRMGLNDRELLRVISDPDLLRSVDLKLFMTHYACADDIDHPKTELQRERFRQAAALLPGIPLSAANSAAVLQASGHEFDLTRPGIALYGGEALNDTPNPMKPVVTVEGRIVLIREAKAGDAIGYGASETLTRNTRIAYLSVGYADGYHRAASNFGVPIRAVAPAAKAAFKGKEIKGVGRVSMDLCAFDVTDIPESEISAGDWIELFGPTIPVDDVARASGTIGYELLTGLGHRYSKIVNA